jgi:Na+/H+-dicarboxylate symporter
LAAIGFGIIFGIVLPDYIGYVDWMGELFLRLLKMVVIPMIFCALVSAITGIKEEGKLGILGIKTVLLYFFTTLFAVFTALFFVGIFQPGTGIAIPSDLTADDITSQAKSLRETLLHIFPDNPFAAFANANMLPIVVFAILFGIFLTRSWRQECLSAEKSRQESVNPVETLIQVFEGGNRVFLKMTVFVIMLAPFGVFGIIAENTARFAGDTEMLAQLGRGLGLHCITVVTGLAFHLLITLSVLLWFFGRCNPYRHLLNMSSVILTAFSTDSSNATLPVTLEEVMKKDGVSEKVAGFVLPLGATLNMNGTALYECAVVLFIANAYGIELTLFQQFITVLMVLLTAVGTAGIPMGSIVMIGIILHTVGLPPEGIGLVLAVDRPLDMCRTALNVYSDTCCAAIIAKTEGEKLQI